MTRRTTKAAAILLILLYVAAGLHMLAPHSAEHHSEQCALCTLVWTFVAIATVMVFFEPGAQTQPAPVRRNLPALATRFRPWSGRAPPYAPVFHTP